MQSAGAREKAEGGGIGGGPTVSLAQVVSLVKGTDVWLEKVDQPRRKLRYSGCLCFMAIGRHANDIATVFVGSFYRFSSSG